MAAQLTPKRAVSYIRVSTREQAQRGGSEEGFSLPAQREANKRKAQSMGALVVKEFADRGESARSANRPELQKMLAYLKQDGGIDYVIVHKLDRLARNRADDVEINRAFEDAGVRLVSTSENIDQTPGGMLLHGIMSSIAEFYFRNLANEVMKGMGEKARNGGTLGKAPLGYLNVRAKDENGREIRTIALDEERAPLIRLAFTEYATGQWTTKRLAAHLHDRGLTTVPTARKPAKAVSGAQLHRMLRHPYYKGVISFQGVEYPGAHEPLVDEETWGQVQAVLDSHRFGERERQHNHHLKTTVYCGLCGARLLVQNTRNSKGDLYPYFICARRQRTHDCTFKAVLIDVVEDRMNTLYRTIQLSSQDRQLVEQYVREELRRLERDKDRTIRSLTTRRTNLEDKRRRLMHAHYEGAIPLDLLKEEQAKLTSELDHIERQLTAYQADAAEIRQHLTEALDLLEDCHRLYQAAPPHLKKLLNQVFFERVLVNPAVDEDGRVILPEDGTNDDGDGNGLPDAVDGTSDMTGDGGAADGALDPDPAARVVDTAADGNCLMGEDDGPVLHTTTLRFLADASSNATVAADLRQPFNCLTSRLMHNVARQHRATLLQANPQANPDNQADCPVTNTVCNDEALTSGGERFASSTNNPDRVTHDLGLGKAIVVPPLGFEPRTLCLSSDGSPSGRRTSLEVPPCARSRGAWRQEYICRHWTSSAEAGLVRPYCGA
jgi:DNA invertase Pin-like site-specific DNA recombinase